MTTACATFEGQRPTFLMRTAAQVNSEFNSAASMVKRSPMGKLARLAKIAGGNGNQGNTAETEQDEPKPLSEPEPEAASKTSPDKFSKSRSPIQCLNPMRLQQPQTQPHAAQQAPTCSVDIEAEAEPDTEATLLLHQNPMNRFDSGTKEDKSENGNSGNGSGNGSSGGNGIESVPGLKTKNRNSNSGWL